MKCRFLHAADIHLGYEQYNLLARADDFARAYMSMVEYAVDQSVDFVLIAGDLFNRASADAWMLKQATAGLETLRQAGIPVVTVEGNHDAQHARKHLSWLEFLCDQELLVLLNVRIDSNGYKSLPAFDPKSRRGSYIDIAGIRMYGVKYYGAALARMLDEIRGLIEPGPNDYTILMLHAGMEGQVPHMHGGLTAAQVAPLHPPISYLALGHVHKRLEEGWIFNPGSLETNSMEEMHWPHGFFDVRVDTGTPEKHVVTAVPTPNLRPFYRISVTADETGTLGDFVARAEAAIASARVHQGAVVELHLGGVAPFNRQDVPVEALTARVELTLRPLVVRVRNNLVPPGSVSVRPHERMSLADIERQVIEQLVRQDGSRRDRAAEWTRLILDVKNMAVEKDTAGSIIDHVQAALASVEADGAEELSVVDGVAAATSLRDAVPAENPA